MHDVRPIQAPELEEALPLLAGYQRFYGVERPDDDRNRAFFGRFVAPSDDGLLLGGWAAGEMAGFANLYWTFSSISAAEIVLLSDLFVRDEARGRGLGKALIEASIDVARERGAHHLEWLTAADNVRAQRLYEAVGAERSEWLGYEIAVEGP
jgi:GNAT superfamily N-acetyltransferase